MREAHLHDGELVAGQWRRILLEQPARLLSLPDEYARMLGLGGFTGRGEHTSARLVGHGEQFVAVAVELLQLRPQCVLQQVLFGRRLFEMK